MPKKKNNLREHSNYELRCLRQDVADMKNWNSKEFIPALRLRLAIGGARTCTDQACRRHGICAKPILDCTHRSKADDYDWDWGWFHCQRKELYGVDRYEWNNGFTGGSEEFREAQMQAHRDRYEAFAKVDAKRTAKG
jgi:hypothetical protein